MRILVASLFVSLLVVVAATAAPDQGTILFTSYARSSYAFDIFYAPVRAGLPQLQEEEEEIKLTDGLSINYNGHFVGPLQKQSILNRLGLPPTEEVLAFVLERHGFPQVHWAAFSPSQNVPGNTTIVAAMGIEEGLPFQDRPSLAAAGQKLIYVSTKPPRDGRSRQSWPAVYSSDLSINNNNDDDDGNKNKNKNKIKRLTPDGVADYSPAVSPSGEWLVVASDQAQGGFHGELCDPNTDLFLARADDGSGRRLLVRNGGWPSWGHDSSSFFFHRQDPVDGWWSVYRANLSLPLTNDDVEVCEERITPPGIHCFTPAASLSDPSWLALATRGRNGSSFRQIQTFHLHSRTFTCVSVNKKAHHYNPFVSADSTKIGYHKCGGARNPHLEYVHTPLANQPALSLVRVNGDLPSFSPDGAWIAHTGDVNIAKGNHVYVTPLINGSRSVKVYTGRAFTTAWDWKREGVIYTSIGTPFGSINASVQIVAILNVLEPRADNTDAELVALTKEGTNNAFPSPSPDGLHLVFRSGRSGYKNLYIIDLPFPLDGSWPRSDSEREKGLRRLTEGAWMDTMCNWSPDGQWIAFASNRDNPQRPSYALFRIRPDGTDLQRVLRSGEHGEGFAVHPYFSPDSKALIFTSDYAGLSAEPISGPNSFQPYGDIFAISLDGARGPRRMTYTAYETGNSAWGRKFVSAEDLSKEQWVDNTRPCGFGDTLWLASRKKEAQLCNITNMIGLVPNHMQELFVDFGAKTHEGRHSNVCPRSIDLSHDDH